MRPAERLRFMAPIVAAALTLAACSSTADEPDRPAESAEPASFAFDTKAVVTPRSAGIDEAFVNPGAIIEDNGTLHMYANVFTQFPGPMRVPHLTSTDGVSWTLAEDEPVLTNADIPLADPGFDVSTGYVRPDGTWVLVFETVNISDPWVLGQATAPGPDGPWRVDPDPILVPGPEGSADSAGLSWPSVVRTDDGYFLYYTADDGQPESGTIAVATSDDGRVWHKRPDPVIEADQPWELGLVDRPRAVVTDDGIAMVYAGGRLDDRGLAWSDDGITWTKEGDGPVIDADSFPVSGSAWDAALIAAAGQLVYYLEIGGGTPSTGTKVYRSVAEY